LVSIGVAIVVIPRAELRHYPASAAGFKEKWDDGEPARKSRNAEYNLRCRISFVAGASNLPAVPSGTKNSSDVNQPLRGWLISCVASRRTRVAAPFFSTKQSATLPCGATRRPGKSETKKKNCVPRVLPQHAARLREFWLVVF
jgi:hypothetical protein